MEAELSLKVTEFRSDPIFETFNMQSIEAFKPYADWFLKNSLPFQTKGQYQIYGMNDEYHIHVCSILKADMMLYNTDTSKLYGLNNTCFYLYLMAYCLLNLQAYQNVNPAYSYLYHNLFSAGGFEQEGLTGNFLLPNRLKYKPLLDILNNKHVKIPPDSKNILNNSNIQIYNLHYNPVLNAIIEESNKKDRIANEQLIEQIQAKEQKSYCPFDRYGDCSYLNPKHQEHATHMAKFIHKPHCQYGLECYRKTNQDHNKDFFHPPAPAASAIHTVKKTGVSGSIIKDSRQKGESRFKALSGSIRQRAGQKKSRQNKLRPKKTHKKRQYKHKKRHNKSKKLI